MEKKKKNRVLNLQEQDKILEKSQKTNDAMPKQVEELINKISKLELEIAYMEKYLLSLYRKTFEKRIPSSISRSDEEGSIRRCQSSLSHRFNGSISRQVLDDRPAEAYHSLPLSMLERSLCPSPPPPLRLGESLDKDVNVSDFETPNWVSEELIKSISEIYCELAEPPLTNHLFPSSSTQLGFFLAYNSNNLQDYSRDGVGRNSSSMVEIESISKDAERMKNVGYMLRKFRSLVHRLRQVDPSKMKLEEKIAFWINVHNALGMHAFLVNGVPGNKLKRMSILLKASYNVGGHAISLEMIQNYILHCKLLHPAGQWLRLLFLSRHTFNARKSYAIPYPEPLLQFALCCGHHSDAAVRVYRPKNVFEELKAAKEEYLHSNLRVHKGKICLPRLVGTYLKLSGSSPRDLLEGLAHIMPADRTISCIEWIPHNYNFRFILSNELV